MSNKGFSHIGLSTHDLDATRDFYEEVLGFEVVRCDVIKIRQGGFIRHMFVDVGRDQLIAFMEPNDIPGLPTDFDPGINRGLGIPGIFYHFAFEAGVRWTRCTPSGLKLIGKGVGVTDIVDHDWAMSIYFSDPNGISLEYCCLTRDIGTEDDVTFQERLERSIVIRNGEPVFMRDAAPDPMEPVLTND